MTARANAIFARDEKGAGDALFTICVVPGDWFIYKYLLKRARKKGNPKMGCPAG